jgi:outer membrane protein assembly factor BamD
MRDTIARLARLALAALLIAPLIGSFTGCSIFGKEYDQTEGWSASKLYKEASSEMDSGNYLEAIKLFEKLEARYPFGRYAMQAQLDVAYAYYKADEHESAIAAADRFIKLYPQNPYVDYAYYLKGLVNYNRSVGFLDKYIPTDPSQRDPASALDAFVDFSELVKRFPDSKYAPDARQRMLYLRNNLAEHEVEVARYYMKRGAFMAAANRCTYVIEHFERTPAVEDALVVLVDAYRALGDEKLASDTQRVLELNRKEGRFAPREAAPGEVSLARKLWDYLKLD